MGKKPRIVVKENAIGVGWSDGSIAARQGCREWEKMRSQ
jgi:hypothetical protein